MKYKTYDFLGASAATLCLVHCLIFPVLVIIPIGISHSPYIDFVFWIIGSILAFKVCKKEKSMPISILFAVSLLAILTSIVIDFVLHIHLPLIYFGSVGLIIGHIVNHRRAHA